MPAKDKTQLTILISCIIVSAYGFWAATLWQEMFEAEKMANRKANRIETRIGKIEEPKFDRKISTNSLKKLEQELASSYQQVTTLTSDFIDIDNAEKLQAIKLDISELADNVKLDIQDFKVLGISHKSGEEELSEYLDIRKQYYQRPYLSLQAQGDFFSLLNFLDAISTLENVAVVQQLEVNYVGQGRLAITMKILV